MEMQTRREVLAKCGAGLAAIIAAGKAPAVVVRSMLGARGAICSGSMLPYKKRLEYINIGPGQYIDTGWTSSYTPTVYDTFNAEIRVKDLSNDAWDFYIGGWNGTDGTIVRRSNQTDYINFCSYFYTFPIGNNPQYNYASAKILTGTFVRTGLERQTNGVAKFFYGDKSADAGRSTYHSYSIGINIGGMYYQGDWISTSSNFDIKSFKLYTDGVTLLHDLIPIIDYQDEPCMYDKLTGEFHYNAGTGRFLTNEDA